MPVGGPVFARLVKSLVLIGKSRKVLSFNWFVKSLVLIGLVFHTANCVWFGGRNLNLERRSLGLHRKNHLEFSKLRKCNFSRPSLPFF